MSPLAKPVAGPYLLPEREYPFTMAVFVASEPERLAFAQTVLKPRHGLLRSIYVPPVAQWVGEPVDAVILRPHDWPSGWTSISG
jgi:hypothetical protein